MKSFCICKKKETQTAMSLGGIESSLAENEEEAKTLFQSSVQNKEIGLIIVSEDIYNQLKDQIFEIRLRLPNKLIIQIPEPEGLQNKDYILTQIRHSIGIHI